jgi:hypothetical protein
VGLTAYLYIIKLKVFHFFNVNKNLTLTKKQIKLYHEIEKVRKDLLAIKCKKAAQEIDNIHLFSYWPITKSRQPTSHASLVYLDTSKKKQHLSKRPIHTTTSTTTDPVKNVTPFNKNTIHSKVNKDKKIT